MSIDPIGKFKTFESNEAARAKGYELKEMGNIGSDNGKEYQIWIGTKKYNTFAAQAASRITGIILSAVTLGIAPLTNRTIRNWLFGKKVRQLKIYTG